jgi:hypothetical protein
MKNYSQIYDDFKLKYWLYTEGFGFLITVPVIIIFIFLLGEFSNELFIYLLKVCSVTIPIGLFYIFWQNKKLLSPFDIYFTKLSEGKEVSDEVYKNAFHRYSNLPLLHSIPPIVAYNVSLLFISMSLYFQSTKS